MSGGERRSRWDPASTDRQDRRSARRRRPEGMRPMDGPNESLWPRRQAFSCLAEREDHEENPGFDQSAGGILPLQFPHHRHPRRSDCRFARRSRPKGRGPWMAECIALSAPDISRCPQRGFFMSGRQRDAWFEQSAAGLFAPATSALPPSMSVRLPIRTEKPRGRGDGHGSTECILLSAPPHDARARSIDRRRIAP
jgi:hypothetical protein